MPSEAADNYRVFSEPAEPSADNDDSDDDNELAFACNISLDSDMPGVHVVRSERV